MYLPHAKQLLLMVSCAALCLLSFALLLGRSSAVSAEGRSAVLLETKGVIGPAVSEYLQRGLVTAKDREAALVIIRIDTPGGLDLAMRDIIQAILASSVPVITYVSPDGARAASAGTYILYASHVAAMAPATNLGAATPVRIGGVPGEPDKQEKDKKEQEKKEKVPEDTMERKIINDAAAFIKALAERHGRNAEWAVQAVRESVSLSAREALAIGVIDIVATDIDDLLRQADGRQVRMESGVQHLETANLAVTPIEQSWRVKLLAIITDPNIAYMLMLGGVLGLIYELSNPGLLLPGVAGSISLLLALYAFQVLPVNYSGLALMLLGVALMVGETFMPSFGVLGIGGIVAFSVGSIILMKEEEFSISPLLIGTTAATFAVFMFLVLGRVVAFRRKRVGTGTEAMIGMTGEAVDDFTVDGRVWLLGESWQARSAGQVKKGEKVKVTAKDGLLLTVEKLKEDT
ncbi:MAG: serine protease [Desulfobacterales bacterium GWB2_56_26]|nr:MAG: serine protease [Desulfobacterales bacterium GWB2_56_26]